MPAPASGGSQTTVSLGQGQRQGRYALTPDQILAAAAQSARRHGLGDEGARVAQAILATEGGLTGDVGDVEGGGSVGPTQLYWGGQLGNLARDLGTSKEQAATWVQAHPTEAVDWSLRGYLGQAIKQGMAQGLSGPALATYAQRHGQVSVSPERAGQQYQALFGRDQTLFGATTAEAAELGPGEDGAQPVSEPQGQGGPSGGAGVDTQGDRPPSEFDAPSRFGLPPATAAAAPTGGTANARRIAAQLQDAQQRLGTAQERLAAAEGAPAPDTTVMTKAQASTAREARDTAIKDARTTLGKVQDEIKGLEKEQGAEQDKPTAPKEPSPKSLTRVSPAGVTQLYEDGQWVDHPELGVKPATGKAAPSATRTYQQGGATYTESGPDVGGFGPLPGGITDPNAMTPYQAGSLGVSQQNAASSAVSAAAAQLHAQVAKGTLDFTQAKTIFDYVVAQQAPVEEGGALYRPGRQPSSSSRQQLGLSVQPYSVVDAAGFYGRPELNQYVRGGYPFGAGPMSPAEYQARQAGGFQPGPGAQPAPASGGSQAQPVAAVVGAGAPAGPTPEAMAAGRQDAERAVMGAGGGFQPGPTPAAMAAGRDDAQRAVMGAGVQPAAVPGFGATTGGGADVLAQQQAVMAETEKIRQHLMTLGFPPQTADAAARQYVGAGQTMAQTPV